MVVSGGEWWRMRFVRVHALRMRAQECVRLCVRPCVRPCVRASCAQQYDMQFLPGLYASQLAASMRLRAPAFTCIHVRMYVYGNVLL